MGKIEIFQDKIKEWRFNFIAKNGKVIAVGEGYNSRRNAENGIDCILKLCKDKNTKIVYRDKK